MLQDDGQMTFDQAWESLSQTQKKFVLAMQDCSTKKEAAEQVGVAQRTTYAWPDEVDFCIDRLIDHQLDAVRTELRQLALDAVGELPDLVASDDESTKLQAVKYVLDQAIGKAKQTQQVEQKQIGSVNVTVKNGDSE